MATHDNKIPFFPSPESIGQEQNAVPRTLALVPSEKPETTAYLERRAEVRMDYKQCCSYEVLEAIEEESVVIRQGEAFALNRSKEGMLLLMGQALFDRQLFEVQGSHPRSGRTVNVFETRWARPIPVESLGKLYLVGCQRIFGPLPPSPVQQVAD
jgi:hypothetical protein